MAQDFIYTKSFLAKHWDELVNIGIPLDILEDIDKWTYFYEHGDYPKIPFSTKDLDKESVNKLNQIFRLYP